jgi:thiamine-phosphate pyrophosphorylase
LYVITDSEIAQQAKQPIESLIEQAIAGGARIVQYRNKNAPTKIQHQEALRLAQMCHEHQVTFLVNDDVDLAMAVNADGVHLGQGDLHITSARQRLGAKKIIGITCHNELVLAERAQAAGADYVAFGRFFPSRSKPEAPAATLNTLIQAKQCLQLPVCAIGGITAANAPQLIDCGVDMLAVIHAVLAAADIEQAARQFANLFE